MVGFCSWGERKRVGRDELFWHSNMLIFTHSLDKHQNNTAKWRALKCLHRHGPYELLLLRLAAFPRRYVLGGRNRGCVVWPRLLFLTKTVHARGLPLALFSFRKSACMPCLHPTKKNHTRSHMQTLLDPHKNPHPPTRCLGPLRPILHLPPLHRKRHRPRDASRRLREQQEFAERFVEVAPDPLRQC